MKGGEAGPGGARGPAVRVGIARPAHLEADVVKEERGYGHHLGHYGHLELDARSDECVAVLAAARADGGGVGGVQIKRKVSVLPLSYVAETNH